MSTFSDRSVYSGLYSNYGLKILICKSKMLNTDEECAKYIS